MTEPTRSGVVAALAPCGCAVMIVDDDCLDDPTIAEDLAKVVQRGCRLQHLTNEQYEAAGVGMLLQCKHPRTLEAKCA